MKHTPRPYQARAIDLISKLYRSGTRKVLLHLATGSGKTFIFCEILKRTKAKGKTAIMVVKGRKLVQQASDRLTREGVAHGVMMAGHRLYLPEETIQVCSIDTMRARQLNPPADLIVIDEAHLAMSPSYIEFLSQYPDAFFLPVTATPYGDKSMAHIAQEVIAPVTFDQLVSQGFLVPPRYFAPVMPNLKGIKTTTTQDGRDYAQGELADRMSESFLVDNIVQKWIEMGQNRPTVCFAVNIAHSRTLRDSFIEAGIPAVHVDASSNDRERLVALEALEKGIIKVITNCGILSLGVDIPCASCILSARPTKSLTLYIQQMGRGTRPYPGKKDFIILDCAGNIVRHGFLNREHDVSIIPTKRNHGGVPAYTTCPECFTVFLGNKCHNCGWVKVSKEAKETALLKAELAEILEDPFKTKEMKLFASLECERKQKKHHYLWTYHRLEEKAGLMVAKRFFPNYGKFH